MQWRTVPNTVMSFRFNCTVSTAEVTECQNIADLLIPGVSIQFILILSLALGGGERETNNVETTGILTALPPQRKTLSCCTVYVKKRFLS